MPTSTRECPCGERYDVLIMRGEVAGNLDAPEEQAVPACHACGKPHFEAKVIVSAAAPVGLKGYPYYNPSLGETVESRQHERELAKAKGFVEDDRTLTEKLDGLHRAKADAAERKATRERERAERNEQLRRDGSLDRANVALQSEAFSPQNILRAATDPNFRLGRD